MYPSLTYFNKQAFFVAGRYLLVLVRMIMIRDKEKYIVVNILLAKFQ